jgi:hypothetical protein
MAKRTQTRFIARMIEGAVPSEMPGFVPPGGSRVQHHWSRLAAFLEIPAGALSGV